MLSRGALHVPAGLYGVCPANPALDPSTRSLAPSLPVSTAPSVDGSSWRAASAAIRSTGASGGASAFRPPRRLSRRPHATAPLAYEAAAIFAFRGKATISHRSAAKLHGLLPWPPKAACWVTTPRGDSDRPGLIVRKATLEPCDITSIERIKVTTAARTILDCAAILPAGRGRSPRRDVRRGPSRRAPSSRPSASRSSATRASRASSGSRSSSIAARGQPKPKRDLERKLLKLVRASDLPEPEVNALARGQGARPGLARAASRGRGRQLHVPRRRADLGARTSARRTSSSFSATWSCALPGST